MTELIQLVREHWQVIGLTMYGGFSVFASFMPTPEPNTWYNAWFHVVQYFALSPGRSFGVARANGNGNHFSPVVSNVPPVSNIQQGKSK